MAESTKADEKKKVLRRDFLAGSGAAIAAGALVAGLPAAKALAAETADLPTPTEGEVTYPASTGYIVYDSRLCFGCQSCMFACSMAHQGEANPTLSRIQIVKDAPSFTTYPRDIVMAPCRQCVSPLCVENCPTGAAHIDTEHGNVRVIDQKKCIGCERCIQFCPQRPHRTVWNPYLQKSSKCDLCLDAPYWSKTGGPDGEQACVSICPSHALKLVHEPPPQMDEVGYDVNLAPPLPPPGPPRRPGTPPAATQSAPKV
jgi:protein NrfC